ncbi:hypothetical protein VTJ04DRAFT_4970 [Mycothermus thermophilus]|uniref:uncharacterized protein n=1 Tax=Humicola insolens TaxID=85995 RepID=UPI003743EE4F
MLKHLLLLAATSRHGGYTIRKAKDVRWYGTHPKIIYHKEDGAATHAFRFAKETDDKIENHTGLWFREGLVSYNGFPSVELRIRLFHYDFGDATMAIKDSTFAENLKKAIPKEIKNFDVNRDEGSPGSP